MRKNEATTPDVPALTDLWHFLVKLPPEGFRWSTWFTVGGEHRTMHKRITRALMDGLNHVWNFREPKCGTTACVAGWAAFRFPERLRAAVRLHRYEVVSVADGKLQGSDAFARAFGLSGALAEFVCIPGTRGEEDMFRSGLPVQQHQRYLERVGRFRNDEEEDSRELALLHLSTVIEACGGPDLYAGLEQRE